MTHPPGRPRLPPSCCNPETANTSPNPQSPRAPLNQSPRRPAKPPQQGKPVPHEPKRNQGTRRNTTGPETRLRNGRSTTGKTNGSATRWPRTPANAGTAPTRRIQARPCASPVSNDTANTTDSTRKRKSRPPMWPRSRTGSQDLNQSQGGMCIYNTSVIGLGFSQKSFGL